MAIASDAYRFEGGEAVRTPALLIYAEQVDRNIAATLRLLGGTANRWRPHLKTAKLAFTMERLRAAGVAQAKCATTLELETACAAGFEDVLLAYPVVGPAIPITQEIAARYPAVRVSALVEDASMVDAWRGRGVSLFVDVNPGMNRTGAPTEPDRIAAIARSIQAARVRWAGLHFYEGPTAGPAVLAGYDLLLRIADHLRKSGLTPPEIVTAGTPAFPAAGSYAGLTEAGFLHRLSPGTLVYCDVQSLGQLPAHSGHAPAALVLSRVVSHPAANRITCDAGHKTVSADAGDPTCIVLGHPDWTPRHPSEEHLPIDIEGTGRLPPRGTELFLLPQHICPTVNNFDSAVVIQNGKVSGIERVTARGRHAPLPA